MNAIADKYKITSSVYKWANNIFAQKNNNGVNQSTMINLVVGRKISTDATYAEAMNRIGYNNAYFNFPLSVNGADIKSVNDWVSTRRKIQIAQTSDIDVKSQDTTDFASDLKNMSAGRTAVIWHANDSEGIAGALSAILASTPTGSKSFSYKTPTGITVDALTDTEEASLRRKNANFYVAYIGGAGDYGTRYLTSDNGTCANGDEIQKVICVDRTDYLFLS